MMPFFCIHISQGSVATRLGCGGVFVYDFVTNFLLSLTVVMGKSLVSCFFDSRCSSDHSIAHNCNVALTFWYVIYLLTYFEVVASEHRGAALFSQDWVVWLYRRRNDEARSLVGASSLRSERMRPCHWIDFFAFPSVRLTSVVGRIFFRKRGREELKVETGWLR